MSLTPLSDSDLLTIRQRYIRDLYIAGAPATMLSHYNKATKSNWIDDAGLQEKALAAVRAWHQQLAGVYEAEHTKRLAALESEVDADAAALALQKEAFFRLIRASVFEDMMLDPGFNGSMADDAQRAALFEVWRDQIKTDRTFVKSKSTAGFRGVPIERL